MSPVSHGLTPRLKPLGPRKSATLSVLDVGTSKVVCLVAELIPADGGEGGVRTHVARVLGIGHQRSAGLKGGAVVDLEAAEGAIGQAIAAAERMARVEIRSVIVNLSGGRLGSRHLSAEEPVRGGPVGADDVGRALAAAGARALHPKRAVLHALPTGFTLDAVGPIADPSGMVGDRLGVDLHVVSSEAAAARNLMLAVERCHLDVEAVIATPYAAGLSALVDDEAEMGAVVIDLGGGTTSVGVFGAASRSLGRRRGRRAPQSPWTSRGGFPPASRDAERLKVQHGRRSSRASTSGTRFPCRRSTRTSGTSRASCRSRTWRESSGPGSRRSWNSSATA
jgi:cell division protein FtsA